MTDLAESLDASTTTFSIPPATDRELITLWVERQDAKSLETIIRRHGRLVHSLTHKLLTSPHDRADAFQTVFLMLSQQAQKIRQRESLAMWIYGVTVRTCLMMSRQRAHAPIPDNVEAPPYPDREVLEHQELILTLNKELHLLPEHLRESLVLVYLEGHSRQTAAELMNTTEQTIKSRLARGRNLLRARLLKHGVTFTTAFTTFSLMTPSSEAAVILPEQLIDQTLTTCQTGELTGGSFTLPLDPITILPTGAPVMSSTTFYGTLAVTTLLLLTTMGMGNRGQAEGRVAAVDVETAVDDEVVSVEDVTSIVKMTPATPVIPNTHAPHDVPVERSVPSETQSEEELSKSDNSLSPSNPGNSVSMQPAVEDETQQLPDQYSFQLYLDLKLERAKLNVAITEKQLKSQEELYRRGITSSDVEQAKLNRLDARIEYMEVLKEREVLKEVSFVPARPDTSSIERSAIGVPDSGDLISQLILPYTEMAEEYMQNRRVLLQLQISKEQPLQVSNIEDAISQSMNRLEQDLKSIEESFRAGSDDMAYQLTQIRDRVYESLIDELTRIIEYHEAQLSQSPSDDPRDQQILDHRRQTLKYLTYEKSLGSFDAVSQHIRTDLSAIVFKEKPNEKLRKKLLELREDFGPDHPEVKRVEEQLRSLEESLGERERLRTWVPEQRDDSSNRLDKSKVNIVQSLEQAKALSSDLPTSPLSVLEIEDELLMENTTADSNSELISDKKDAGLNQSIRVDFQFGGLDDVEFRKHWSIRIDSGEKAGTIVNSPFRIDLPVGEYDLSFLPSDDLLGTFPFQGHLKLFSQELSQQEQEARQQKADRRQIPLEEFEPAVNFYLRSRDLALLKSGVTVERASIRYLEEFTSPSGLHIPVGTMGNRDIKPIEPISASVSTAKDAVLTLTRDVPQTSQPGARTLALTLSTSLSSPVYIMFDDVEKPESEISKRLAMKFQPYEIGQYPRGKHRLNFVIDTPEHGNRFYPIDFELNDKADFTRLPANFSLHLELGRADVNRLRAHNYEVAIIATEIEKSAEQSKDAQMTQPLLAYVARPMPENRSSVEEYIKSLEGIGTIVGTLKSAPE